MNNLLKMTAISDLHGILPLPEDLGSGDILFIAGDLCSNGRNLDYSQRWLLGEFNNWLNSLDFNKIFLTPGNHDFIFEKEILPLNCEVLIDKKTEYNGLKIYGTPYQPIFFNWCFNLPEEELKRKWEMIPNEIDILLLHSPPFGIGDKTKTGRLIGSKSLLEKIKQTTASVIIFGHNHQGNGKYINKNKLFINASLLDEDYHMFFDPIHFSLKKG